MSQVIIIQGEDRVVNIGIKDSGEEVYIDLTGATAISVKTTATAGGAVEFTLAASEVTITDAPKGKFSVAMSDTKTALIKLGEQPLEITVDWGTNRRIVQQEKAVLIKKKLF
jgi:hypothetical protein